MTLPIIIGLTGRKYAGKTEAARILAEHGYFGADIAITDPMIEIAIPLLAAMGVDEAEARDRLEPTGRRKEEPIPGFEWLSGRKVLQVIGKDLRDALSSPNAPHALFYDLWEARCRKAMTKLGVNPPLMVNQSVRYPVERTIIKAKQGEVWRIVNPDAPPPDDEHVSEAQDWPVDHVIEAPHSMGKAYLKAQIEKRLTTYK